MTSTTIPADSVLSPLQRAVARRVIDEESHAREHVVVYLSGAHAYGFPSPDSDLDLKAIHVVPTRALLGLAAASSTSDRIGMEDDIEIDYTSNELGHALRGMLHGNGNYLERVLGATWLRSSELHAPLADLVRRSVLSRRVIGHYRGFARSQMRELERAPTAKRALYVLRTALTGIHLLATGEMVTDVTTLLDDHGFADARELVTRKLEGERVALGEDEARHWLARLEDAFSRLEDAYETSVLPEDPPDEPAVSEWLVATRLARV